MTQFQTQPDFPRWSLPPILDHIPRNYENLGLHENFLNTSLKYKIANLYLFYIIHIIIYCLNNNNNY